jgi:hypothetical protein
VDVDPRTNVVVFQLNDDSDGLVVGRAPTLAEDGVRRAWEGVRHEHDAHSTSVVALHAEWEPSPGDVAFIETTFPEAAVTFNFPRPTPDGWDEAFAAAQETMLEAAAATDGRPHPAATGPRPAGPTTAGLSGLTGDGQGQPVDGQGHPGNGRGPTGDVQERPGDGQGHPRGGPGSTGDGEGQPGDGQDHPDSGPGSTGDVQERPGDGQSHPDSGPGSTGDVHGRPGDGQGHPGSGPGSTGDGEGQPGDGQDESAGQGELLPVLWSQSSPRAEMLEAVPHWPVASGRLHLALAVVAPTPRGTIGMYHVTHQQLGDHSFNELMAEACENLASGLRVNGHETDEGQLLSLSGTLVSAMVCLPDFYRRLSELANAERLVVGLPCPDEVYVAAADSPMAAVIQQAVHQSEYPTTELVPTVLSIVGDDIEVLSERD